MPRRPPPPAQPPAGDRRASIPAAWPAPRGRRRDRHGRGLRGPLLPRTVPAWQSNADRFDDLVLDAVERLETRWASQLEGVEFAVEDVPPSDPAPWEHGEIPLGRFFPAQGTRAPRVVLYRRPIETRAADEPETALIVHEVVVEQVAHLLGLTPEQVDSRYGDDE